VLYKQRGEEMKEKAKILFNSGLGIILVVFIVLFFLSFFIMIFGDVFELIHNDVINFIVFSSKSFVAILFSLGCIVAGCVMMINLIKKKF
jgi:hypothetical protein